MSSNTTGPAGAPEKERRQGLRRSGPARPGGRAEAAPGRRRPRRFVPAAVVAAAVVVATLAGLVASGLPSDAAGASAGRPSSQLPPPSLQWRACQGSFRCAWLTVPVSYAHPTRGTFRIAVVELPATGTPRADLLMNPGGPGAPGVSWLEQSYSMFPASLRQHVNLVSFDPRGIGESDPVRCLTTAQVRWWLGYNPDPRTPGQIAADVAAAKTFVKGCEAHSSKLFLANIGTINVARDLDRLRAALGQRRLDYIGFSYGTFLGEVYAELFPSHVGRFVLDGVVDPAMSTYESGATQAAGFQSELSSFFAWCPTNATCSREFPHGDVKSAFARLIGELSAGRSLTAVFTPAFGGTQHVDLGMAETAAAQDLYQPQSWPQLASAIYAGLRGNGDYLALSAYEYAWVNPNGTFPNLTDALVAIGCVDSQSPPSLSQYKSLAARFAKVSPYFGPLESWGGLPCAYWPVPVTGPVGAVHAPGTPPVLVVGSTGDPATPYSEAVAVAKQFPKAVLLTRRGNGHTGYDSSSCVRSAVDAFFESGALPKPGTVCSSS